MAQNQFPDRGPVWAALLQSFTWVEEQCADTLEKVANQVPEILAQHIPEGQVGVFLAALYQLICTQQQGITSMVVAQAGVPVHLRVHSWAATASMTRLFTQVILGLGSLSRYAPATIARSTAAPEKIEYMPIPQEGNTMVPARLFPRKQVRKDGTANRSIYLGNDTDSGISSISCSTPVKTLVKTPGSQRQPFASTPKTKPKLLVMAQQQWNELAAMKQGAPHGAHVRPFVHQAFDWKPAANPGGSGDCSFVSIEEHTQYTTATLMQRDAPNQVDPDEDVVSIQDDSQSDIEMVSAHEPHQHTEDSSPDSGAEDSHNPSDDSDMESNQDRGSSHHSDLGFGSAYSSNLGSDPGFDASSNSGSRADPDSSDENGGDLTDMFQEKKEYPGFSKRPESRPQSSSRSRSRETENQK